MTFNVTTFLTTMAVLLVSIAVHEFCHAIVADRLGDPTPRNQGRVTLNPLAHLDPMGTIMILMSSYLGFGIGWGRPVQVNPANFRTTPTAGMGIVAVAGPLSNLFLALLGAMAYRFLSPSGPLLTLVIIWITVNVALAFFNLIPVFPLDGFNVLVAALVALNRTWSRRFARFWRRQLQYGPLFLVLLLIVDYQFPAISPIRWVFRGPARWFMTLLLG